MCGFVLIVHVGVPMVCMHMCMHVLGGYSLMYVCMHMRIQLLTHVCMHECGSQRSDLGVIPHETTIGLLQACSHTRARLLTSRLGGLDSQLRGSTILHCFPSTGTKGVHCR